MIIFYDVISFFVWSKKIKFSSCIFPKKYSILLMSKRSRSRPFFLNRTPAPLKKGRLLPAPAPQCSPGFSYLYYWSMSIKYWCGYFDYVQTRVVPVPPRVLCQTVGSAHPSPLTLSPGNTLQKILDVKNDCFAKFVTITPLFSVGKSLTFVPTLNNIFLIPHHFGDFFADNGSCQPLAQLGFTFWVRKNPMPSAPNFVPIRRYWLKVSLAILKIIAFY